MSQQSEMANVIYEQTLARAVPMAEIVGALRLKWGPEFNVSAVHGFAREVATCLLHYKDIVAGDFNDGKFAPWLLEAWDADARIDSELMSMDAFLEDRSRYVFQRK